MMVEEGLQDLPAVYLISNAITGDKYVGQSWQLLLRLASHQRLLEQERHINPRLQAHYKTCGSDAFSFSVLEYVDLSKIHGDWRNEWRTLTQIKKLLRQREKHYIRLLNPSYNLREKDIVLTGISVPNRIRPELDEISSHYGSRGKYIKALLVYLADNGGLPIVPVLT